jgi:hypothetical protein
MAKVTPRGLQPLQRNLKKRTFFQSGQLSSTVRKSWIAVTSPVQVNPSVTASSFKVGHADRLM